MDTCSGSQITEKLYQRDLSAINPDQEDTILAGLIYAHEWLARDDSCQCSHCFIQRTLCTALVITVRTEIKCLH
jgi:hypothetical protein